MASTPIIRSPMRPARKGEAPTVEWAQWVEKTLRRLIDSPTPRNRPVNGGDSTRDPLWTTISIVPDSDPVEYQATISPGYLCYQQATLSESDSGVVGYLAPKIRQSDGTLESIEPTTDPAWTAPTLALDGVVNYIYLRVKTDADGAPKSPTEPEFPGDPGAEDGPTIEAFTEPQTSIHHVRPSPSGGEEEGDYFFLICQTESNGATPPAPRIVRRITGNRELPNQLIEIRNLGGKREIYEGYEVGPDDKHKFRSLEQLEERGEPIILPLDEGDPDADPPVPPEEEGETIKWKTIDGRDPNSSGNGPTRQIDVSTVENGKVVEVRGNGVKQFLGGLIKSLSVDDGLVTDFQELNGGWWGVVRWYYEGVGDSSLEMELAFESGILVSVTGGIVNFGTGTEADPGDVTFATEDTV